MPSPSDDADLTRILASFHETATHFRNGAIFFGCFGAAAVVGAIAKQIWWLAALSLLIFCGGALLNALLSNRTTDPDRSPLLHAVLHAPETVVEVTYRATSSSWLFRTHWLQMRLESGKVRGIKVHPDVLAPLASSLARRLPRATFNVPGIASSPRDA